MCSSWSYETLYTKSSDTFFGLSWKKWNIWQLCSWKLRIVAEFDPYFYPSFFLSLSFNFFPLSLCGPIQAEKKKGSRNFVLLLRHFLALNRVTWSHIRIHSPLEIEIETRFFEVGIFVVVVARSRFGSLSNIDFYLRRNSGILKVTEDHSDDKNHSSRTFLLMLGVGCKRYALYDGNSISFVTLFPPLDRCDTNFEYHRGGWKKFLLSSSSHILHTFCNLLWHFYSIITQKYTYIQNKVGQVQ